MIVIKKQRFIDAVKRSKESNSRIAAFAGVGEPTLYRMLAGKPNMNLKKLEQVADYVGLDVEVRFIRQKSKGA